MSFSREDSSSNLEFPNVGFVKDALGSHYHEIPYFLPIYPDFPNYNGHPIPIRLSSDAIDKLKNAVRTETFGPGMPMVMVADDRYLEQGFTIHLTHSVTLEQKAELMEEAANLNTQKKSPAPEFAHYFYSKQNTNGETQYVVDAVLAHERGASGSGIVHDSLVKLLVDKLNLDVEHTTVLGGGMYLPELGFALPFVNMRFRSGTLNPYMLYDRIFWALHRYTPFLQKQTSDELDVYDKTNSYIFPKNYEDQAIWMLARELPRSFQEPFRECITKAFIEHQINYFNPEIYAAGKEDFYKNSTIMQALSYWQQIYNDYTKINQHLMQNIFIASSKPNDCYHVLHNPGNTYRAEVHGLYTLIRSLEETIVLELADLGLPLTPNILLNRRKALIDMQFGINQATALHNAIDADFSDGVKYLIKCGASLDIKNKLGFSAFDLIEKNHAEMKNISLRAAFLSMIKIKCIDDALQWQSFREMTLKQISTKTQTTRDDTILLLTAVAANDIDFVSRIAHKVPAPDYLINIAFEVAIEKQTVDMLLTLIKSYHINDDTLQQLKTFLKDSDDVIYTKVRNAIIKSYSPKLNLFSVPIPHTLNWAKKAIHCEAIMLPPAERLDSGLKAGL